MDRRLTTNGNINMYTDCEQPTSNDRASGNEMLKCGNNFDRNDGSPIECRRVVPIVPIPDDHIFRIYYSYLLYASAVQIIRGNDNY